MNNAAPIKCNFGNKFACVSDEDTLLIERGKRRRWKEIWLRSIANRRFLFF
jgi:hypothetical protein